MENVKQFLPCTVERDHEQNEKKAQPFADIIDLNGYENNHSDEYDVHTENVERTVCRLNKIQGIS